MLPRPLFIASIGNPAPYTNTLHSAGHLLLSAIRTHLSYPPFTKSRPHANGLVSRGQDALLWQSPAIMNVSGPAVATAWQAFLRGLLFEDRERAKLVIVHDELEAQLGKIKVREGGSARGHNGIKSCVASLGGKDFTRIGVGIGRPESRDSKVVADYVLGKMTPAEIVKVGSEVEVAVKALVKLRDG